MDCCSAGNSNAHANKIDNQEKKKIPWFGITMILLIIGLLVFSILK